MAFFLAKTSLNVYTNEYSHSDCMTSTVFYSLNKISLENPKALTKEGDSDWHN
jgi:hypothetical protein